MEVCFYFAGEKNHTSGIRAPKTQRGDSLTGLMVVLKSLESGRVVIPPIYKAAMVKVIAQLISAVKIYINVQLRAAGSIKPLC